MPGEIDKIKESMAKVSDFMETRYNPLEQNVTLIQEEQRRLATEVKSVLNTQKRVNLAAVTGGSNKGPRVQAGKYRGCDAFDLSVSQTLLKHVQKLYSDGETREGIDVNQNMLQAWDENLGSAKRALDDITPGAGDEFLYTGEASEMWRDVHLATAVASLFPMMMMPTNPFQYPFDFGDISWYRGAANIAASSSNPLTGRRTLTAEELVGAVAFSYNLEEDSVVAVLPELRRLITRNAAEVIDDMLLNGDMSDDGTNINANGATGGTLAGSADYDHFLIFDGLLHVPLVDRTAQRLAASAANDQVVLRDFLNARERMQRFGVRPSEVAFIVDIATYIKAQAIEEFTTIEKFGPYATIITGQLGAIGGIPVIVSEWMLPSDDTDGKVSNTAADNTHGRILAVNREQWRCGYRRELMLESERDIQRRQTILVPSMRIAFEGRNENSRDQSVGLVYGLA